MSEAIEPIRLRRRADELLWLTKYADKLAQSPYGEMLDDMDLPSVRRQIEADLVEVQAEMQRLEVARLNAGIESETYGRLSYGKRYNVTVSRYGNALATPRSTRSCTLRSVSIHEWTERKRDGGRPYGTVVFKYDSGRLVRHNLSAIEGIAQVDA